MRSFRIALYLSLSFGQAWLFGSPQQGASDPAANFLFLTGRVVHPDGSPPNEPIQVELVCGGRVQQQVFTFENGSFSLEIGQGERQNWMDSSVGQTTGLDDSSHWNSSMNQRGVFAQSQFKTYRLSGCAVRVRAGQGLTANEINLGNRSVFQDPHVGILVLGGEGAQREAIVSVTTLSAPSEARKPFEKATEELSRTNPDFSKATKHLQQAVGEYPEFAEAWYMLGLVQSEEERREDSRRSFERAVAADPKFVKPYLSLARLELFAEDWQEAARLTEQVIALSPRLDQAYYYNGLANFSLNNYAQAEKSFVYLKSNGYGQRYPMIFFHLGVMYARQARIQESGDEFSTFLDLIPSESMDGDQRKYIESQLGKWQKEGLWRQQAPEEEQR